ncbi:MAG: cytochrome P450 [Acidimicrobiales bacterium]|nr:cytochrome P450 [Acidimicrobiales bacterium]RZV46236.1 MAG: cytochrome P450 [Acidimicrobiales bacterium]
MSEGNDYHAAPAAMVKAPSGCPVNHEWSPLNDDYLADPYPIAYQLREDAPIFFAEELGYVVVNRMEDIVEVFTNPDVYASTIVQNPVFPIGDRAAEVLAAPDFNPVAVMSNRPEPDHGRIRKYTRAGFSRRRLKTLEPYIVRRANELIDDMLAGDKPREFIEAFAFPLPGETVFRFIGFPESDDELLKNWCSDRKAFSWGRPTEDEQVEIAEKMLAYWRYCREFTATKRDNRADDFASELVADHEADPDDISYREVESVIYGLSFAGHEAVTALICNALLCLLPRRDQWQQLVDDPSLIPNAVEEVVRFESSQVSWRRITTQGTTLAGVDIPANTPIFMNFASANRQPDLFENPTTFDIHRSNAAHNISFGKGIHFCLGANLAKLEVKLVLEALTQRVPSLRLVEGQPIWSSPNITFRGPEQLLVTWD